MTETTAIAGLMNCDDQKSTTYQSLYTFYVASHVHAHTHMREIAFYEFHERQKSRKFWNSIHPPSSSCAVLLSEWTKQSKIRMVTWSVAVHKPCSPFVLFFSFPFLFHSLIHSVFASSSSGSCIIFVCECLAVVWLCVCVCVTVLALTQEQPVHNNICIINVLSKERTPLLDERERIISVNSSTNSKVHSTILYTKRNS